MLTIKLRERDGVTIADLSGRLTLGAGDKTLQPLTEDLLARGQRDLVLNLREVEFIDSSGLGELIGCLRAVRGQGGRLRVLNPGGRVYDTLSLARLLPLFEVFQSEEEVVASFAVPAVAPAGPEVRLEVAERVAVMTLNRKLRFNALTRSLLAEAVSAFAHAVADPAVRAVVITGAGRAFCFGADAEELREGTGALPTLELFQTLIRDIALAPQPVIAAVNGFATGAGLDLALACDLRVLAEKAKLSSAFVRFGLVPDGGSTHTLPRLIGPARAAEMILGGRAVDAAEALAWGLVNRVVPAAEVLPAAVAWARDLARGPGRAMARAKLLLRANPVDLGAALAAEANAQAASFADPEFHEGLKAHLEKREPCFPA